jgi:signal transduction histidine kinase
VRITCGYDEERDSWLLRVRDNGVGIPEDEQDLIFRRFRRGKAARGKVFGLGLSIVREASRRVNGDVTVESQPGEGSTFTFAFPAGVRQPPSTAE